MDRRSLICSLPLLWAASFAHGQKVRKVASIGILTAGFTDSELAGPNPGSPNVASFLRGMSELGHAYGTDFVTVGRGGQGRTEEYAALAADLVRRRVDVIVAGGPTLPAVMRATASVPVVMVGGALDPVRDGFARSLGQPGGNVTGISLQQVEISAKRLEILKEAAPAALVGVLWEETSRSSWIAAQEAARSRGWKIVAYEVRDASSIERAFKSAAAAGAGAILIVGGGRMFGQRQQIVDLAAAMRVPAMYSLNFFVEAGGLMSYAADLDNSWYRAASFVDRILKGVAPAALPIEQATKFDLVINLKAARAQGLTLPQALLLRADRVIE